MYFEDVIKERQSFTWRIWPKF